MTPVDLDSKNVFKYVTALLALRDKGFKIDEYTIDFVENVVAFDSICRKYGYKGIYSKVESIEDYEALPSEDKPPLLGDCPFFCTYLRIYALPDGETAFYNGITENGIYRDFGHSIDQEDKPDNRHYAAARIAKDMRAIVTLVIKDFEQFRRDVIAAYGTLPPRLAKLTARQLAYAFIGAKEAVDSLRWRTVRKRKGLNQDYEPKVIEVLGPLPDGKVGLNGTTCFANGYKQWKGRHSDAEEGLDEDGEEDENDEETRGNGYLSILLHRRKGDPVKARKAIVFRAKSRRGFACLVRCLEKEHKKTTSRIFRLELPIVAYGANTPAYLSAQDAQELGLDSMRAGSSRLAMLRISERNDSSPPLAPSMVTVEDERVLLRWDLILKVESKSVALKWPTAIGRDTGRAALFALVRDYAGQASIDAVWQQLPSFLQTWPKKMAERPSDVSEQAWQSAQTVSRGRHTRWQNAAKGKGTCSLFNERGNDYRQHLPLHSSRESRYISIAIDASGVVWYAHRRPNDWTSPLDWKRYDGEKSKALLHLINVCRRLYGLAAIHKVDYRARPLQRKGWTEDQLANQLVAGLDFEGPKPTLFGKRLQTTDTVGKGRPTRLRVNPRRKTAHWWNAESGKWRALVRKDSVLDFIINKVVEILGDRAQAQASGGNGAAGSGGVGDDAGSGDEDEVDEVGDVDREEADEEDGEAEDGEAGDVEMAGADDGVDFAGADEGVEVAGAGKDSELEAGEGVRPIVSDDEDCGGARKARKLTSTSTPHDVLVIEFDDSDDDDSDDDDEYINESIQGPLNDPTTEKDEPRHRCYVKGTLRGTTPNGHCVYAVLARILGMEPMDLRLCLFHGIKPDDPRIREKRAKIFPHGMVPRGRAWRRFAKGCSEDYHMDQELLLEMPRIIHRRIAVIDMEDEEGNSYVLSPPAGDSGRSEPPIGVVFNGGHARGCEVIDSPDVLPHESEPPVWG